MRALYAAIAISAPFARACIQPREGQEPRTKLNLGRILDECTIQAFRAIATNSSEAQQIYDQWPEELVDGAPITHWANISETHGLLSDPEVERAYESHPGYHWNEIPPIPFGAVGDIDEQQVLIAFLTVAIRRFFVNPAAYAPEHLYPPHNLYLEITGEDNEDYEYVIVRPSIEHNMLGIILGKGGSTEELGATLWGQTELSCMDDSMHGLWGMRYVHILLHIHSTPKHTS